MFLYSVWRATPLPTRIKIANAFGIAKVGPTHVRDNYIESDGYKIEDVERALNIDAIQKYIGLETTDMQVLWDAMVAKAEGKTVEPILVVPVEVVEFAKSQPSVLVDAPKKRGRKPKIK